MEAPPAAESKAVSTDTTSNANGTTSHSPLDGAALAESDLLGFGMTSASTDDFATPQETLASSTDLLDFTSAPTSMSTSPETNDGVAVQGGPTRESEGNTTGDLLGFMSAAPAPAVADETSGGGAEQSQPQQQVANDLLDFMPAPQSAPSVEAAGAVNEVTESQSPQVLLDVFSSEPSATATMGRETKAVDATSETQTTEPVGVADAAPDAPPSTAESFQSKQAQEPNVTNEAQPIEESQRDVQKEVADFAALPYVDAETNGAPSQPPTQANDAAAAPAQSAPEALSESAPSLDVDMTKTVEATKEVTTAAENDKVREAVDETQSTSKDDNDEPVQQCDPTKNENAVDNNNVPQSESLESKDVNVAIHENEGMADVELDDNDNNIVQSPAMATFNGHVLSESVTKNIQQVDPWQTENVASNNESAKDVSLNEEPTAQQTSTETATASSIPMEPSPTMVDIPLPPEEESSHSAEKDALLVELQSSLQDHMTRQAEAEDRARKVEARMKQLEEDLKTKEKVEADLEALKERLKSAISDKAHLEVELAKLRTARDEHERKEIVLGNRLNAAKKKEALKADLAERLEEEVKELRAELSATKEKLADAEGTGQKAEQSLEETTQQMTERVRLAETALADERRLNEDRKKKMKAFIEAKQEEVRQGKVQTDELNAELEQTNRLLREQNSRWKQLHAQWVQSQTRNRELQRDLNRIKKDSDNMHKIGGKMEMKLDKAAQQTEEHKNKRLTAKHELMTILRTLEGEREVSSKLRDSLKFTFTPKALSQQQLLKESLKDFDAELEKLSRRLGKPLPPTIDSPTLFSDEDEQGESTANPPAGENNDGTAEEGEDIFLNRSEIDSNHLISNLENETQRVSQCIMALTSSIERMHVVLDESGPSSCINSLATILIGGAPPPPSSQRSSQDERTAMRSTRYGQVPTS